MEAKKLAGYQAYYDSLNHHDQKRIGSMQWDLLLAGIGKEQDFVALVCWHIAIDQARESGIATKRDANNETGSRVTGKWAAKIKEIDRQIFRNMNGDDSVVLKTVKAKAAPLRKLRAIAKDDDFFGI